MAKTPTGPMSAAQAVSAILSGVSEARRLSECSDVTGVPHGTLRRLRDGQKTVKAETIAALRNWPGFGERFDALTAEAPTDAGFELVARRLSRTFSVTAAESIAFQLEVMSEYLDEEAIQAALRQIASVAAAVKPPEARKSPQSAKKSQGMA